MTKIEEIIENNRNKSNHYADQDFNDYGDFSVESAMKEYAEYYAKRVLKIAAEKSYNFGGIQVIDQEDILNIKLPEHV